MFEMALHDLLAEAAEGLLDAGDLDEDFGAVAIFFDHFVQAADLAFDPFEALEVFFFGHSLVDRRRRLLARTLTELRAMAALARMGLSWPKAASGIPMAL